MGACHPRLSTWVGRRDGGKPTNDIKWSIEAQDETGSTSNVLGFPLLDGRPQTMGRMGAGVFSAVANRDSHPLDQASRQSRKRISHEVIQSFLSRINSTRKSMFPIGLRLR
jgi:hypothetical protein